MPNVPVYNQDGKVTGEMELSAARFGVKARPSVVHLAVVAQQANAPHAKAHTKTRGEVSGGGKKPGKQKGTGRARAGSIRSPLWRGGGTVFGPTPRDYSKHIPQALKRKALISALSLKNKQENILVVEDSGVEQPKTKELVRMIRALKLDESRTLCVVKSIDENLKRAFSNLREIFRVVEAKDFNAYQVLRRKKLLIDKQALPVIVSRILEEPIAAEQAKPKRVKEKVGV